MTEIANGKATKFRELAEKRVSKILNGIRHVGNLSSRSTYDYRPDQVAKMFKAIRDELTNAEDRFSKAPKKGEQRSFSLE